jgi:hypothetical protein
MSKWLMQSHFRHLHFNSFSMRWRTPQGKVFWPLQSNSEISGVPKDSQVPISGMWVSSSHFSKNGNATSLMINLINGSTRPHFGTKSASKLNLVFAWSPFFSIVVILISIFYLMQLDDALPSSLLDPLEGLSMWNYGKMELEGRSRLATLKGVRGAC